MWHEGDVVITTGFDMIQHILPSSSWAVSRAGLASLVVGAVLLKSRDTLSGTQILPLFCFINSSRAEMNPFMPRTCRVGSSQG